MSKKIEKLIIKYLTNVATTADLDILSEWINEPDNARLFKSYVGTYYAVICSMKKNDSKKTVEELLRTIRKEKSFVHQLKTNVIYKYAAAASFVLMISLIIFLNKENSINLDTDPIIVDNQIQIGTYKAILTLATGEELPLEKGDTIQTQNASSNGEEIVYSKVSNDVIVYNHLTIPRGGQFVVKLSDGTQVWLNSETQLKYPVNFKEGEPREVELVYGEAYFEVTPSTEHNGSIFKVMHKMQDIDVLGTKFNVKAYDDEEKIYTTLIEGSVKVKIADNIKVLKPSELLEYAKLNDGVHIKNVRVEDVISWRTGYFNFNNEPFKNVAKVLSRWYNIDFYFENEKVADMNITGVFSKNQNLEHLLLTLRNIKEIDYEINQSKVLIK